MQFVRSVLEIVVAGIIINFVLGAWNDWYYLASTTQPTTITLPPALATPAPTLSPTPTNTPVHVAASNNAKFGFVLLPIRIWFNKDDAIGYREAMLDGRPTREFISLEKSRTVRGNLLIELKSEDGLMMVKVEGTDVVGWMQ